MDWTRADLKTRAKEFLRTRYWYAFLATWLAGILGGLGSGGSGFGANFTYSFGEGDPSGLGNLGEILGELGPVFLVLIAVFAFLAACVSIALSLFVAGPVQIGMNRWFCRTREGAEASQIGLLFSIFRKGSYLKAVGAYAWMTLWMLLWSLPGVAAFAAAGVVVGVSRLGTGAFDLVPLGIAAILVAVGLALMIPAYMKYYAYRMTTWILADNPTIGHRRALQLSIAMTDGHKGGMFVLDLSFLLWYLAGFAACCVGVLFVTPYVVATWSELYATLKSAAVSRGLCTADELGYVKSPPPAAPAAPPPAEEGTPA